MANRLKNSNTFKSSLSRGEHSILGTSSLQLIILQRDCIQKTPRLYLCIFRLRREDIMDAKKLDRRRVTAYEHAFECWRIPGIKGLGRTRLRITTCIHDSSHPIRNANDDPERKK